MQEYDAPHWHWGPGYCEKHRGQGLPCKACIEAGDCTISGTVEEQSALQQEVTEAVNSLPFGNPCAEIMLPSDGGIGGRLNQENVQYICPPVEQILDYKTWRERPIAKGKFEVFIDGKLVGTGENLVVKATGVRSMMDVSFGGGKVPCTYAVPGPDGEITFFYNYPVKREDMKPGVAYQHHWGSADDADGRPGAFFKKEDIEKCLLGKAWVLKPFEGFPNGPSNVDQVGVAGNPSPQGEVRRSSPPPVSSARKLCEEVERITGRRPTAGELAWKSPEDCLTWARKIMSDYCLPWHEEGLKGWAAKLWDLRLHHLNEELTKAIKFGEDYGSSVDVLRQKGQISPSMAGELMERFNAKYPALKEWQRKAKSVMFGGVVLDRFKVRVTEQTGDGPIREVVNKKMGTRVLEQSKIFGEAYRRQSFERTYAPPGCSYEGLVEALAAGMSVVSKSDVEITDRPGEEIISDARGFPIKAKNAPLAGTFTVEQIGDSIYHVKDGWAYIKDEWNSGGLIKFRPVEEMRQEREFFCEQLGIPYKMGGMLVVDGLDHYKPSDQTPIIRDETSAFKNPRHYEALRQINEQGGSVQAEQPARPRDDGSSPGVDRHDPEVER